LNFYKIAGNIVINAGKPGIELKCR